jgi:hypothetical protein
MYKGKTSGQKLNYAVFMLSPEAITFVLVMAFKPQGLVPLTV